MKLPETKYIIHIFALLHAVTSYICLKNNIADEIFLTVLTLLMSTLVCYRNKLNLMPTIWLGIFATIIGYLIGTSIGDTLHKLFNAGNGFISPAVSFATTEMMGFAIDYIGKKSDSKTDGQEMSASDVLMIVLSSLTVILVRLGLSFFLQSENFIREVMTGKVLYFLTSFCAITMLITIFSGIYALVEKKKAETEKKYRRNAQYKYQKLQQQLKPHFLFNSLNILKCLVSDGRTEDAEEYIGKMSDLYRYMLDNEDRSIITLEEEMTFVNNYMQLMQVRFPKGLEFRYDISEADMSREVVPGSVQMLLENSIKHNSVSAESPLVITISIDGDYLRVENNIQLKKGLVHSTGKGLKYIKQQYEILTPAPVSIVQDQDKFTVELPLI